jgi:hypothetical protein
MSKWVKIVLVEDTSDDYYSRKIIRDGITDWEEISDEDFQLLRYNVRMLYDSSNNLEPMLIVKDDVPVVDRLKSIKDALAKERAKQEAEKRKREEAKLAREQAKLMKKVASEKALFEQLKAKFEPEE